MEELAQAENLIRSFSAFSYVGVYGLALFANLFPGIPEEVFLILFGYFSGTEILPLSFWITSGLLIVGFFTTDMVLYWASLRGTKYLNFFKKKLFNDKIPDKLPFVESHINVIVFVSRFVMYFRWTGPLLAGMVKMPYKRFMLVDLIALVVYVPSMMLLGQYFGNRFEKLLSGINIAGNIIGVVVVLIGIVFGLFIIKKLFVKWLIKPSQKNITA